MPSTTELLDILEMSAPAWNREGAKGLLKVLNDAQNILMLQEMAQTQAYRTDDELPYISTTEGTYQYTLNQATTGLSVDIWRVAAVLVKPPYSTNLNNIIAQDYNYEPIQQRPIFPMMFNGVEYYLFHEIATVDAKRGGHPTLQFTVDPGTSTDDFHLLCYEKPTELTSENVALTVPEDMHYESVLPVAMKLLEAYTNNTWVESMQFIEKEYKRKFRFQMSEGAQGVLNSITRNEE